MERTKISKADIAKALEVSPGMVSQWASGLRPVALKHAPRLAELIGEKPEAVSAAFAGSLELHGGLALEAAEIGDARRPDQALRRAENDAHALNLVIGSMLGVMIRHRPAEAKELAAALRRVPKRFRDRGLILELLATLDAVK